MREIAQVVVCLGPWGRTQTNAYLVRGTHGWVLVDTGWAGDADRIEAATRRVLGDGQRPKAIAGPEHQFSVPRLSVPRWSMVAGRAARGLAREPFSAF